MSEHKLKILIDIFRNQSSKIEFVKFKEAKTQFDLYKPGKYFSALSNEANLKREKSAWLIMGIKNKAVNIAIVGSNYRSNSSDLDSLIAVTGNEITNRITFKLKYPESGRRISLQIPSALEGVPVAWKGQYYIRDGEDLIPFYLYELEYIRNQKKNEDWSKHLVSNTSLNAFEKILFGKLPENLDISQKKNKITNILQSIKNEGIIKVEGEFWKISKSLDYIFFRYF